MVRLWVCLLTKTQSEVRNKENTVKKLTEMCTILLQDSTKGKLFNKPQ